MATHSSGLAWRISGTGEPGGLPSMGSHRVGHDWATSLYFHFHALGKEMATHSSILAWRISGTGEPGGLPSVGSPRVGHDWSDLAVAACHFNLHAKETLRSGKFCFPELSRLRILESKWLWNFISSPPWVIYLKSIFWLITFSFLLSLP